MSFLTGTGTEVLYSSVSTGTQLATFTTEDNLQKTLPVVALPALYFYNMAATGKTLHIKAQGRLGTTGAPTFTWNVRLLTSTTWSAAGVVMATSALTAGTTQTLAPWTLDVDITCRSLTFGATGTTLAIMGEVRSALGLASPFMGSIPANNTAFTVTLDNSVSQYIFLSAACGTSNAANLIQMEMLKVYGEN